MKIALVDDDRKCLAEMERICQDFGVRNQLRMAVSTFDCGETFLEALGRESFSVVFMDIFMDGMDGVTAALRLREADSRCLLVFLTFDMDYMREAFSCHAFEYVSKPFSPQRIERVLRDAVKVLPVSGKYVEVVNGRTAMQVFLDDIVSVLTDAHYLDIGLRDGTELHCRMTIPEFLGQTGEDDRFLAVNRGVVLNADHIVEMEDNCCVMENGARFPVRVRDRLKIEQAVQDYHFRRIRSSQRKG